MRAQPGSKAPHGAHTPLLSVGGPILANRPKLQNYKTTKHKTQNELIREIPMKSTRRWCAVSGLGPRGPRILPERSQGTKWNQWLGFIIPGLWHHVPGATAERAAHQMVAMQRLPGFGPR